MAFIWCRKGIGLGWVGLGWDKGCSYSYVCSYSISMVKVAGTATVSVAVTGTIMVKGHGQSSDLLGTRHLD